MINVKNKLLNVLQLNLVFILQLINITSATITINIKSRKADRLCFYKKYNSATANVKVNGQAVGTHNILDSNNEPYLLCFQAEEGNINIVLQLKSQTFKSFFSYEKTSIIQ